MNSNLSLTEDNQVTAPFKTAKVIKYRKSSIMPPLFCRLGNINRTLNNSNLPLIRGNIILPSITRTSLKHEGLKKQNKKKKTIKTRRLRVNSLFLRIFFSLQFKFSAHLSIVIKLSALISFSKY